MTENIRNASEQGLQYRSPQVKAIVVKVQGVLCQSGNEPMREVDYGDGGFSEE